MPSSWWRLSPVVSKKRMSNGLDVSSARHSHRRMEPTPDTRSDGKKEKQRATARPPLERTTLDELSLLDSAALAELYRQSVVPATLLALDGYPRGRMLAVRGLDRGVAATALRSV